jgi:hypothetical protein
MKPVVTEPNSPHRPEPATCPSRRRRRGWWWSTSVNSRSESAS